ncbi:MAG: hypothetical protein ACXVM1_13565, partial [Flavisolibacter sp.]
HLFLNPFMQLFDCKNICSHLTAQIFFQCCYRKAWVLEEIGGTQPVKTFPAALPSGVYTCPRKNNTTITWCWMAISTLHW